MAVGIVETWVCPPKTSDVEQLSIDLADEFAHLNQMTKPTGRMCLSIGLQIWL